MIAAACGLIGCAGETFTVSEGNSEAGIADAEAGTSDAADASDQGPDVGSPFCNTAATRPGLVFCDAFDEPAQLAAPFGFDPPPGGFGTWTSQDAITFSPPRAARFELTPASAETNFGYLQRSVTTPAGARARFRVRLEELGAGSSNIVSLSFVTSPNADGGLAAYEVALSVGPNGANLVETGNDGTSAPTALARTIAPKTWTLVELVVATSGVSVAFDGVVVLEPKAPIDTAGSGLRAVRVGAIARTSATTFRALFDDVAIYDEL
jgi:hypothetical protein